MPLALTPSYFGGPFRGMNDLVSARHIGPGDLVDGLNIVNEAGSIRPRPGYEMLSGQISGAPLVMAEATGVPKDQFLVSDVFYYCGLTAFRKTPRTYKGTDASVATLTQPRAAGYIGTTAYVAYKGTKIRAIATFATSPSGSDLATIGSDTIYDIAIDSANSMIYVLSTGASNAYLYTVNTSGTIGNSGSPWVTIPDSSLDGVSAIALDLTNNKILVYGTVTGEIRSYPITRATGEITNTATQVVTGIATHTNTSAGLAVDETAGKLYWTVYDSTSPTNTSIYVADDDGSNTTRIAVIADGGGCGKLRHDSAESRLFISDPNGGLIYMLYPAAAMARILSMFSIERGLIGVDSSLFADDWVIGQMFNEDSSEVSFVSWFPATEDSFIMPLGYYAAVGSRPELIVSNDRDSNPSRNYGFQTGYGVADFAYTGLALNTAKGGVIIANGEGNGFFANYVMGNTTARLNFTAAGNAYVLVNGAQSTLITNASSAEAVRQILIGITDVNQVIVTKTSGTPSEGDPTYFDVEFIGGLSGQLVTVGQTSGTTVATFTVTQAGGTETGHKMYLLPCGLPRPSAGSASTFDIQFVQTATAASGSTLDGVYEYCCSYYSSILGLESPRSAIVGYFDPHVSGGPERMKWVVQSLPDTLYFEGSTSGIPFLLCDRLRVYRRRLGNTLVSGEPDGAGDVDYDYFFVGEYDIKTATVAGLPYDAIGEDKGLTATTTRAPSYGYPPANAQYVAIHKGRAHWAPQTPGLQSLYYSELSNIVTGEPGYQYVRAGSVVVIENTRPSDHAITSLRTYAEFLLAHTNHDVFVVSAELLDIGSYQVRRLPGGGGCAGKHLIVETDAMPELGGRLLWPNDRGDIYSFDGASVRLESQSIRNLVRTLVRKTWQDTTQEETGADTMYFGSAILDPEYARIIFSMFVDSGAASNSPIQLVFDLDTQSWTRWNIPAWGWHVIRKLTGSTGKGRALPVFSDASANLFTLQFGKGDNGASFSWHAEFGDSSFGSGRMKQIPLVRFGFETVSYGGTAATVRLDSTIVNELRTVTVTRDEAALNNAGFLVKRIDAASFHHIRHKLSGTIVDDQDHPKLVEREFELDFVGQI